MTPATVTAHARVACLADEAAQAAPVRALTTDPDVVAYRVEKAMFERVVGWVLFAVPAAGLSVLFLMKGGGFTGFDVPAHGLLVVVVVVVVAVVRRGVGAGAVRGHVAHVHGHGTGPVDRVLIARHEAGHAAAARDLGGRVVSAQLYDGDRGGLVRVADLPHGDGPLPAVTFLVAGQVAVGTSRGADADNTAIKRELRGLSRADAAAVRHAATRDARRIVARHHARIDADTATLTERGRL